MKEVPGKFGYLVSYRQRMSVISSGSRTRWVLIIYHPPGHDRTRKHFCCTTQTHFTTICVSISQGHLATTWFQICPLAAHGKKKSSCEEAQDFETSLAFYESAVYIILVQGSMNKGFQVKMPKYRHDNRWSTLGDVIKIWEWPLQQFPSLDTAYFVDPCLLLR